jgi:hypothetical protein
MTIEVLGDSLLKDLHVAASRRDLLEKILVRTHNFPADLRVATTLAKRSYSDAARAGT